LTVDDTEGVVGINEIIICGSLKIIKFKIIFNRKPA